MAVVLNIQISDKENEILTVVATRNKATVENYCKNLIRGWLEAQIRGVYQREFNRKTIPELINLFGNIY